MIFKRLALALLGAAVPGVLAETKDRAAMQSIELKTHTIQAPYLDSEMSNRWWDFGGDTIIRTDQYIRLTGDRRSRDGWLFSRIPLTAMNWEVEVEFNINGHGSLYGDGFAIWVTKERAQRGKVFGFIDKFEGLGVFFDTYKNNRPGTTFPYVMAMIGDGQTEYDKANDGKANEKAGCSARGIRNANVITKARLTYFKDSNLILSLSYKDEDEWLLCFDIPNVTLPQVTYLGFSAETGELTDNHDIVSVITKNLYDVDARTKQRAKDKAAHQKKINAQARGSWLWFLFKIILFGALCGAGYVGFTAYRARQRSRF